jgi:Tn3 transposase DDE domain
MRLACLTLATNAVVTWTTEYYGLAVAALRRGGRWIDDEVLAHIWPTHHETPTDTGRCAPRPELVGLLGQRLQLADQPVSHAVSCPASCW